MTTKKTAPAGEEGIAKAPTGPRVIEGVTLTRIPPEQGKVSHPAAVFKGPAPSVGETIQFTLDNGVTYSGKVSDATAANAEALVEFEDGLKVVST